MIPPHDRVLNGDSVKALLTYFLHKRTYLVQGPEASQQTLDNKRAKLAKGHIFHPFPRTAFPTQGLEPMSQRQGILTHLQVIW